MSFSQIMSLFGWCSFSGFCAVLAFYFLGFLSFCFCFGLFCLWLMVSFSLYSLGFFAACVEAGVVTLLLLGFLGYFYAFVFV
jgi:hypothetical protein